jgi:hypothetical protein
MTSDSKTSLKEKDTEASHGYSASGTDSGNSTWIQPPISQQLLEAQQLSIVGGIYVATRVSGSTGHVDYGIEDMLVAMAADPEIQREMSLISDEFTGIEGDGLVDS